MSVDPKLLSDLAPFTKLTPDRLNYLGASLAKLDAQGIAGDIVQCGIWRGGSVMLARTVSPDRICWLFDTFNGMTEPSDVDISMHRIPAIKSYRAKQQRGMSWQAVSREDVEENLRQAGVFDAGKLRFVVGPVEQTLLQDDLPAQIALLFLDTGWHSSTLVELNVLYPRLVEGGILIVDDYGHWDGARKAVNDYLGALQIQRLERIDYTAVALVR
jgi:hypothetical protein